MRILPRDRFLLVPMTHFDMATSRPWRKGETKALLDECGVDNAQHYVDRIT